MTKSTNETFGGPVRDNIALQRFEMDVDGAIAFANYRLGSGIIIITHTETPRTLRGQGVASQLIDGALKLIQAKDQKVVAGCSFVADYLAKHPEWRKLEV